MNFLYVILLQITGAGSPNNAPALKVLTEEERRRLAETGWIPYLSPPLSNGTSPVVGGAGPAALAYPPPAPPPPPPLPEENEPKEVVEEERVADRFPASSGNDAHWPIGPAFVIG